MNFLSGTCPIFQGCFAVCFRKCALPPKMMVQFKMGPSNSSYLSNTTISHFHHSGRKSSRGPSSWKNPSSHLFHLESGPICTNLFCRESRSSLCLWNAWNFRTRDCHWGCSLWDFLCLAGVPWNRYFVEIGVYTPPKLTWISKRAIFERRYLLQTIILGIYVKFLGRRGNELLWKKVEAERWQLWRMGHG